MSIVKTAANGSIKDGSWVVISEILHLWTCNHLEANPHIDPLIVIIISIGTAEATWLAYQFNLSTSADYIVQFTVFSVFRIFSSSRF